MQDSSPSLCRTLVSSLCRTLCLLQAKTQCRCTLLQPPVLAAGLGLGGKRRLGTGGGGDWALGGGGGGGHSVMSFQSLLA